MSTVYFTIDPSVAAAAPNTTHRRASRISSTEMTTPPAPAAAVAPCEKDGDAFDVLMDSDADDANHHGGDGVEFRSEGTGSDEVRNPRHSDEEGQTPIDLTEEAYEDDTYASMFTVWLCFLGCGLHHFIPVLWLCVAVLLPSALSVVYVGLFLLSMMYPEIVRRCCTKEWIETKARQRAITVLAVRPPRALLLLSVFVSVGGIVMTALHTWWWCRSLQRGDDTTSSSSRGDQQQWLEVWSLLGFGRTLEDGCHTAHFGRFTTFGTLYAVTLVASCWSLVAAGVLREASRHHSRRQFLRSAFFPVEYTVSGCLTHIFGICGYLWVRLGLSTVILITAPSYVLAPHLVAVVGAPCAALDWRVSRSFPFRWIQRLWRSPLLQSLYGSGLLLMYFTTAVMSTVEDPLGFPAILTTLTGVRYSDRNPAAFQTILAAVWLWMLSVSTAIEDARRSGGRHTTGITVMVAQAAVIDHHEVRGPLVTSCDLLPMRDSGVRWRRDTTAIVSVAERLCLHAWYPANSVLLFLLINTVPSAVGAAWLVAWVYGLWAVARDGFMFEAMVASALVQFAAVSCAASVSAWQEGSNHASKSSVLLALGLVSDVELRNLALIKSYAAILAVYNMICRSVNERRRSSYRVSYRLAPHVPELESAPRLHAQRETIALEQHPLDESAAPNAEEVADAGSPSTGIATADPTPPSHQQHQRASARRSATHVQRAVDTTESIAVHVNRIFSEIVRQYFFVIALIAAFLAAVVRVNLLHVPFLVLFGAGLLRKSFTLAAWGLLSAYSVLILLGQYGVTVAHEMGWKPTPQALVQFGFPDGDESWTLWPYFVLVATFLFQLRLYTASSISELSANVRHLLELAERLMIGLLVWINVILFGVLACISRPNLFGLVYLVLFLFSLVISLEANSFHTPPQPVVRLWMIVIALNAICGGAAYVNQLYPAAGANIVSWLADAVGVSEDSIGLAQESDTGALWSKVASVLMCFAQLRAWMARRNRAEGVTAAPTERDSLLRSPPTDRQGLADTESTEDVADSSEAPAVPRSARLFSLIAQIASLVALLISLYATPLALLFLFIGSVFGCGAGVRNWRGQSSFVQLLYFTIACILSASTYFRLHSAMLWRLVQVLSCVSCLAAFLMQLHGFFPESIRASPWGAFLLVGFESSRAVGVDDDGDSDGVWASQWYVLFPHIAVFLFTSLQAAFVCKAGAIRSQGACTQKENRTASNMVLKLISQYPAAAPIFRPSQFFQHFSFYLFLLCSFVNACVRRNTMFGLLFFVVFAVIAIQGEASMGRKFRWFLLSLFLFATMVVQFILHLHPLPPSSSSSDDASGWILSSDFVSNERIIRYFELQPSTWDVMMTMLLWCTVVLHYSALESHPRFTSFYGVADIITADGLVAAPPMSVTARLRKQQPIAAARRAGPDGLHFLQRLLPPPQNQDDFTLKFSSHVTEGGEDDDAIVLLASSAASSDVRDHIGSHTRREESTSDLVRGLKRFFFHRFSLVVLVATFLHALYDGTTQLSVMKILSLLMVLAYMQNLHRLPWRGNLWWRWMVWFHGAWLLMRLLWFVPNGVSNATFACVSQVWGVLPRQELFGLRQYSAHGTTPSASTTFAQPSDGCPGAPFDSLEFALQATVLAITVLQYALFEMDALFFLLHHLNREELRSRLLGEAIRRARRRAVADQQLCQASRIAALWREMRSLQKKRRAALPHSATTVTPAPPSAESAAPFDDPAGRLLQEQREEGAAIDETMEQMLKGIVDPLSLTMLFNLEGTEGTLRGSQSVRLSEQQPPTADSDEGTTVHMNTTNPQACSSRSTWSSARRAARSMTTTADGQGTGNDDATEPTQKESTPRGFKLAAALDALRVVTVRSIDTLILWLDAKCIMADGERLLPHPGLLEGRRIHLLLSRLIRILFDKSSLLAFFLYAVQFGLAPCLLNACLPASVFGYAAMMNPRPHRSYWRITMVFLQLMILVKCIVRLGYCEPNASKSNTSLSPGTAFYSQDDYTAVSWVHGRTCTPSCFMVDMIVDLLCVLVTMAHTSHLRSWGLWNDDELLSPPPAEATLAKGERSGSSETIDDEAQLIAAVAAVSAATLHPPPVLGVQQQPQMPRTQRALLIVRSVWWNIRRQDQKLGADLYRHGFGCELISCLILFFGYYSLVGSEESLVNSLMNSLIPGFLAVLMLVLFSFIVLDRIVYLKRFVIANAALGVVHSVVYHGIMIAWFLHQTTFVRTYQRDTSFWVRGSLPIALVVYMLKCGYLYSNARQVALGVRPYTRHIAFSGAYSSIEYIIYTISRLTPFVFDLRLILDWAVTPSSLKLPYWMKLEDVAHELYTLLCDKEDTRVVTEEMNHGRKDKAYPRIFRWGVGGLLFALLATVLLLPLFLYSSFSPALQQNWVDSCECSLSLEGSPPFWSSSCLNPSAATRINGVPFRLNNTVRELMERVRPSLITTDLSSDVVQQLPLRSYSNALWSVSPPTLRDMIRSLATNGGLSMLFSVTVTSHVTGDGGPRQSELTQSWQLSRSSRGNLTNLLLGLTNRTWLRGLYSPFLFNRQSGTSSLDLFGSPRSGAPGNFMDCLLSVSGNVSSSGSSGTSIAAPYFALECRSIFRKSNVYPGPWIMTAQEQQCLSGGFCPDYETPSIIAATDNDVTGSGETPYVLANESTFAVDAPVLLIESSPVLGASFLQSIGLVAAYTTFVLAVGRVLRFATTGSAFRTALEDLDSHEPLVRRIEYIFIARSRGNFEMEMDIYLDLIDRVKEANR